MGECLFLKGGYTPPKPTDYEQIINYTMLYDSGDECHEEHSGWGITGYAQSGYTIKQGTKNSNNFQVSGAGNATMSIFGTLNAVSLKDYNKILALGEVTSGSMNLRLYTSKTLGGTTLQEGVVFSTVNTKELKEIDVLDDTNDVYVVLMQNDNASASGKFYDVFLTKADDINTLCDKAGVGETDLATLLADTTRLTAIFNSEDAVKYMVASCTGDFMVGVLNSADAVAVLKASPYLNTVIANPHWAKFMMMIPTAKELLGVLMLYDEGDECTDVTGGWTGPVCPTDRTSQGFGTVSKNADSMVCTSKGTTSTRFAYVRTNNLIDVSEYSLMVGKLNRAGGSAQLSYALKTSFATADIVENKFRTGTDIIGFTDISAVNSNICVITGGLGEGTVSPTTGAITVYNVGLFKSDDFITWASLGGIIATDLDTLLADSASMATLMSNEDACKYLVGCTGDLMVSICNSEVAMNALVNNIAYEYAFRHPVWYKFMTMIPTALSAMKSVAVTIPTMTSDTAPSGVASASATYSSDSPYKAFDKSESTDAYGGQNTLPWYVQYEFTETIIPLYIELVIRGVSTTSYNWTFKIQGSADGTNFVDLTGSKTVSMVNGTKNYLNYPVDNFAEVKYVRLYVESSTSTYSPNVTEFNIYGKAVN